MTTTSTKTPDQLQVGDRLLNSRSGDGVVKSVTKRTYYDVVIDVDEQEEDVQIFAETYEEFIVITEIGNSQS